jgi:hypothetical protein
MWVSARMAEGLVMSRKCLPLKVFLLTPTSTRTPFPWRKGLKRTTTAKKSYKRKKKQLEAGRMNALSSLLRPQFSAAVAVAPLNSLLRHPAVRLAQRCCYYHPQTRGNYRTPIPTKQRKKMKRATDQSLK